MGATTINNELRTRFNAQWNDAHPVAWPNVAFTPETNVLWVRFFVRLFDRRVVDIGSPAKTHRTHGMLTLQVRAPKGNGDGVALEVAEQIAAIFNTWCGDTVRCREASVIPAGETDDDWYLVNVQIPFVQDEVI